MPSSLSKNPDATPPGHKMPDGTVYAGISPDTGKPMYTMPTDAPLAMEWKQALLYASKLDAAGHNDWRLPSKPELDLLFNNRVAIGGFNLGGSTPGSTPAGWYWSSTPDILWTAWSQRFRDGSQINNYWDHLMSSRCVR
jgi:hypothetical protein